MKCLVVAAGLGARLREKAESKPLIRLKGVPLIERVIARARSAGIDDFYVVSGYRGDVLRQALDAFSSREGLRITHIVNEQWDRANGVSVLAARRHLDEPFLLLMCDHLMDPQILRGLISLPVEADTVTLAVDFHTESALNDIEDVTRVKCVGGRIVHIGKVIRDFNAIDTGAFLCTPILFDALIASQAEGDDSISGAMNVLAHWNKARTFDIEDRLWVDVDDPVGFRKAEELLETGRL